MCIRDRDAYGRVKHMVESYNLDLELRLKEVNVDDFWDGAGQIRRCLKEFVDRLRAPELYVVLGAA